MNQKKPISRIILSGIIGFFVYLILLGIVNILIPSVNNTMYTQIVNFFNNNTVLILVITIFSIIAEIFWVFYFPLNLPAPLFSALTSVFILTFIFKILEVIDYLTNAGFNFFTNQTITIIYSIVFFLTIIIGYLTILTYAIRQRRIHEKFIKERKIEKNKIINKKINKSNKKPLKKKRK